MGVEGVCETGVGRQVGPDADMLDRGQVQKRSWKGLMSRFTPSC